MLIFSQFTMMLDLLADFLKERRALTHFVTVLINLLTNELTPSRSAAH